MTSAIRLVGRRSTSTSENRRDSIRLLEAKEKPKRKSQRKRSKKDRKKERSIVPTWGSGSGAIVARSGQEPPPTTHGVQTNMHAQPHRYYKSPSNNLQNTSTLSHGRDLEASVCVCGVGEKRMKHLVVAFHLHQLALLADTY